MTIIFLIFGILSEFIDDNDYVLHLQSPDQVFHQMPYIKLNSHEYARFLEVIARIIPDLERSITGYGTFQSFCPLVDESKRLSKAVGLYFCILGGIGKILS